MVTVLTSPNGHKKQLLGSRWNRRTSCGNCFLPEHHERTELYPVFAVASILGAFTLTYLTVVLNE